MRFDCRIPSGLPGAVFCAMLVTLGLSAMNTVSAVAADPAAVIGWIEVQPSSKGPDHITITAQAQAIAPVNGKFRLAVTRSSNGNRSKSQQAGVFNLGPGEGRALSTTTINLRPADKIVLKLVLSVDGQDVFSATLQPSGG